MPGRLKITLSTLAVLILGGCNSEPNAVTSGGSTEGDVSVATGGPSVTAEAKAKATPPPGVKGGGGAPILPGR